MEYTYTQCLLFITLESSGSSSRPLRNSARTSNSSKIEVPSTTKGFALFPEEFKKKRPEVLELFKQNGMLTLSRQNVSSLIAKNQLEIIELLLLECPSASLNPLTISTNSLNKQAIRLFFPNNAVCFQEGRLQMDVRPAVTVKNFKTVEYLFKHNADIIFRTEGRESLLHLAANRGPESLVKLVLELGLDINVRSLFGVSALHRAVAEGHEEIVQLLVDRGADVRAQTNGGTTALHIAAFGGLESICRLLLDHGADIEAQNDSEPTPLTTAARQGQESICQLLLDRGADIQAQDVYGVTPLTAAASNGHESICQLLLDRGADIQARTRNEETCLHLVFPEGFLSVVELLLKNGAMVDARNNKDETALHLATREGHLNVVQTLLMNRADVNTKSKNGKTAILYAVENGNIELVEFLLKCGAEFSVKDDEGCSVLQHAYRSKHAVLFQYLLESCFLDLQLLEKSGITGFHTSVGLGLLQGLNDFDENTFINFCDILAPHLIKTIALKVEDLGEPVAPTCWTDSFPTALENVKTQFKEEAARLKDQTVGDTSISFYSLLTGDSAKMACLLRNESVDRITDAELQEKFPAYGAILVHIFRRGREQKIIVTEGIKICNALFGHFKKLPYEIKERTLAYLSFIDFLSLKEACKKSKTSSNQDLS